MYDAVFGPDSYQEHVYAKTTKPLVDMVIEGYDGCIFAYGATGAGKTHTMVGTKDDPGCMVMALKDIFKASDNEENHEFKVYYRSLFMSCHVMFDIFIFKQTCLRYQCLIWKFTMKTYEIC